MKAKQLTLAAAVLATALGTMVWSNGQLVLGRTPRAVRDGMSVALPLPAQLALAGGDRYLAANINVFRAFMVESARPDEATVATQAALQRQAAFFNPAHEDNYYVAAATLPWQGELDAAQYVLLQASNSRPRDLYPPFFYGFNLRFFQRQDREGARWVEVAASRAEGGNRQALTAMAARWYESGAEPIEGVRILQAMAASTKDVALRHFLQQRQQRLQGLIALREAAQRYTGQQGHPPPTLQSLVDARFLTTLPADPTEIGYQLDQDGVPQLTKTKQKAKQ